MAYRRILIVGEKVKEAKANLDDYLTNKMFKTNYPDIKVKIMISPVKENTLVVDLNGDGADSVSKKVKDIGEKHKMSVKIKNEKPLSQVKESKENELRSLIREEIKSILKEK